MARDDGKALIKTLVVVALVLLAALVAAGIWLYRHPLELYEWTSRRALAGAGLERVETAMDGGRMVLFRGGEGTPLILLHGAGDQAGNWVAVAPQLLAGHHLIVPDLPGHGDSDPAAGPLPFSRIVAGVEALLAGPEVTEPAILVGNSMGAWLAMLAAYRHPEEVARVVLVNGGPVRGEPPPVSLTPADRDEARRLMALLRDPASPPIPGFVLDDIVRRAAAGPIGRLMADVPEMERHLLDGRLGEIQVPVDILWGESDRYLPLSYARRMEAELPRARLTVLPACGHVPHNECPERFAALLAEVLASPPPAAAGIEGAPGGEPPAAGQGAGERP